MCKSDELILIGTEQIRSKQTFIYIRTVFFINFSCYVYIINLTNFFKNPPLFDLCSTLFRLTALTSLYSLTIRTELDFKSEHLFRMCSVVTNLVTSLEFQPIHCATTLFHFGRTRDVYVATQFILLTSTAESSATSGYVVAPKRSGQSEAWAGRNVKRTRKKSSFVPSSGFNRCKKLPKRVIMISSDYFKVFYLILVLFDYFLLWKTSFIFCLCYYLLCWPGNNHFDVHFWRIGSVLLLSKDGNDAVHEGRNGRRGVWFPPKLAFPPKDNIIKVFFHICIVALSDTYRRGVFKNGIVGQRFQGAMSIATDH